MSKRVRYAGMTLLVLIGTILAKDVVACQCGKIYSPLEGLESSKSVFEGIVEGRWPTIRELKEIPGLYLVVEEYKLKVLRRWKGKESDEEILLQGFGNCDLTLEHGGFYLVYADYRDVSSGLMTASKCSATKETRYAAEDFKVLGNGVIASDFTAPSSETVVHAVARKFYACLLGGIALGSTIVFYEWQWTDLNLESWTLGILVLFSLMCLLTGTWFGVRRKYRRMIFVIMFGICVLIIGTTICGYLMFSRNFGFENLLR